MKSYSVLILCIIIICASKLESNSHSKQPPRGSDSRIVNGDLASLGQFPWQAFLNLRGDERGWLCGGSIIHEQWVLTSGFCLTGSNHVYIWAGMLDFHNALPVTESEEFHIPDSFSSDTLADDIGLIRTRSPLDFTDYIKPIVVAEEDVDAGADITTSGYGGQVELLHYVDLETISNEDCRKVYGEDTITDGMICGLSDGHPVRSPCHGDSGGPAVINAYSDPRLVGIVSWVHDEACESSLPHGYTRVVYYRAWIRDVTGEPL